MTSTPTVSELEARLAASSSDTDPIAHTDALNELGWALRGTEVARAHQLAEQARSLAKEHGYLLGQARAARTMAMTMADMDDLQKIFPLAHEARQLFDEAGDDVGRAASRDFLSSLHEFIGDLAAGLEFALDALSIARQLGDPIREGYALSSVGGILAASGETDAGVERLKEALSLFQQQDATGGVGTICSRLAKVLEEAGRYDEACHYAQMCRSVAETTHDETLQHVALKTMAAVALDRGRPGEAERLYREALEALTTQPGRDIVGGEAQIALSRLLMERGALDEAQRELTHALANIEGDPMLIVPEATMRETLAQLCEKRCELGEAIVHLRHAKQLREQIAKRDARANLAQLEMRASIEAARKDAEIHKLRYVELHAMQSKLVEAEKMALLGKLAAGTAHELNTPLGVLRSNTKLSATAIERLAALLEADGGAAAQARKLAQVLESCSAANEEAVERIAAIGESFKRFTQLDQAERRSFDVSAALDSAIALLEPTTPAGVTLERDYQGALRVEGWPREVNHAFLSVLQNAVQALGDVGVVRAEVRAEGDDVVVRIVDDGRGMSEEQVAHLFDVTWSEDGKRTKMRLGLSAAYTTMQKHGGMLDVNSALGEGTTVTFRFPKPAQS